jgi:hypothetical protein
MLIANLRLAGVVDQDIAAVVGHVGDYYNQVPVYPLGPPYALGSRPIKRIHLADGM